MAEYACEYCSNSIEEGGSCTLWEYECPYSLVKYLSEEQVLQIQKNVEKLKTVLKDLEDINSKLDLNSLDGYISGIKSRVNELDEMVSAETLKKWKSL